MNNLVSGEAEFDVISEKNAYEEIILDLNVEFGTLKQQFKIIDRNNLLKKNIRNPDKYHEGTFFMVSSTEWQDVLKATTLAIWNKKENEECSQYKESDNEVCAYPFFVLHEENKKQDGYSPTIFIQQYEDLVQDIYNIILYNFELDPKVANNICVISEKKCEDILGKITNEHYKEFWQTFKTVVISENNYESGIHATIIASSINAPLYFINEFKNSEELEKFIAKKNVITVNKNTVNKNIIFLNGMKIKKPLMHTDITNKIMTKFQHEITRKVSINEKKPYYMSMNRKLIVFNPNDINETYAAKTNTFEMLETKLYSPTDFKKAFYQDSYIVPYLAIARNEHILSINEELFIESTESYPFAFNKQKVKEQKELPKTVKELFEIYFPKINEDLNPVEKQTLVFGKKEQIEQFKVLEIFHQIQALTKIQKKISKEIKNDHQIKYITLVGSPKAIPFSYHPSGLSAFDPKRVSFPMDYYLTQATKNTGYDHLGRGKIMGLSISDTSTLVMRNLFFPMKPMEETKLNFLITSNEMPAQKYIPADHPFIKKYFPETQCVISSPHIKDRLEECILEKDKNKEELENIFKDGDINYFNGHGFATGFEPYYNADWPIDLLSTKHKKPQINIVHACLTLNVFDKQLSPGLTLIRQGSKAYFGLEGTGIVIFEDKFLSSVFLTNYDEENLFLGDFSSLLQRKYLANTPELFRIHYDPHEIIVNDWIIHDHSLKERNEQINSNKLILIGDPLSTMIIQNEKLPFKNKKTRLDTNPHIIINTELSTEEFIFPELYKKFSTKYHTNIGSNNFYVDYTNIFQERGIRYPYREKSTIQIETLVATPYPITAKITLAQNKDFSQKKTENMHCILDEQTPTLNPFLYATDFKQSPMKLYRCTTELTLPKTPENTFFEDYTLFITTYNDKKTIIKEDIKNIRIYKPFRPILQSHQEESAITPLIKHDAIMNGNKAIFCIDKTKIPELTPTSKLEVTTKIILPKTGFIANYNENPIKITIKEKEERKVQEIKLTDGGEIEIEKISLFLEESILKITTLSSNNKCYLFTSQELLLLDYSLEGVAFEDRLTELLLLRISTIITEEEGIPYLYEEDFLVPLPIILEGKRLEAIKDTVPRHSPFIPPIY